MKTRIARNAREFFRNKTRSYFVLAILAPNTLACSKTTTTIVERKPIPVWYEIAKPPSVSSDEDRRLCWPKRSGPNPSKEEALRLLLKTNIFASDGIGYGMGMSAQVQAFEIILAEPDAALAFRHLLAKGNMAGRLYALFGLRIVDPSLFDREIAAYLTDESRVRTFLGSILSAAPVHTIATQIYNDDLGWRFTCWVDP